MRSTSVVIAVFALVLSAYSIYLHKTDIQEKAEPQYQEFQTEQFEPITLIGEYSQELNVQQLQQVINQLSQRLAALEKFAKNNATNEEVIADAVAAYAAKKEEQEQQERAMSDPFMSFFESLPADYEQKLKTDPEYANEMRKSLRQQVLDTSLTETERLQAMAQLQMTVGILAEYNDLDNNNELSNAVMEIANNTADEATRIRALEVVTSGPNMDPKLASEFMELVVHDSNNYVRNVAANGLGMMMYSQSLDNDGREQLANNIIQLMKTTSDPKLHSILEQNFGTEDDIKQSLIHMSESANQ